MIHNLRVRSYSKNGYHGKPWRVFICKITSRNGLYQNVWHVWVAEQLQILQLVDGLGGILAAEHGITSHEDISACILEHATGFEVYTAIAFDERVEVALDELGTHATYLVEHGGDELLSAEAGIDGHDEHEVKVAEHFVEHDIGCARVDGDAGFHASFVNLLDAAMQVVACFLMHGHVFGAVGGNLFDPLFGMDNHHVDVHGLANDGLKGGHHWEAEADVGDEGAVHHVEMKHVGFTLVEHLDFAFQVGEIGAKKTRGDNHGRGKMGVIKGAGQP